MRTKDSEVNDRKHCSNWICS